MKNEFGSYLGNVKSGGGALQEHSHGLHLLTLILKKNNIDLKKINLKKIDFIKNKVEKKIISNIFLDTEFFLQGCTLPHADEYSMYESIEIRNPFLDLELVEFCLNLPAKFKISNKKNNKFLIRKLAVKKYGNFINKKKEGTRNYSKYISNKKFWNFDNFKILKMIKIKEITKEMSFKEIFKIINLEILIRSTLNENYDYLKNIISKKGLKEFKIKL